MSHGVEYEAKRAWSREKLGIGQNNEAGQSDKGPYRVATLMCLLENGWEHVLLLRTGPAAGPVMIQEIVNLTGNILH